MDSFGARRRDKAQAPANAAGHPELRCDRQAPPARNAAFRLHAPALPCCADLGCGSPVLDGEEQCLEKRAATRQALSAMQW